MKKIIILFVIMLFSLIIGLKIFSRNKMNTSSKNIILTIVYDNNDYNKNLQTAWGFSCLIKIEDKNILFDTGGNGSILLSNMEKLQIDPTQINTILISHIHGDHSGGLEKLLEKNANVTVYLPKSFPQNYKQMIQAKGANLININTNTIICNNVISTGELTNESIKEQALIIQNPKGLVIITGCAHPGIIKIIDEAKKITNNDNIFLVIGGFHLTGQNKEKINEILQNFKKRNVKYVGPCHCSGNLARDLFNQEYQENYINIGVGKIINLENLK